MAKVAQEELKLAPLTPPTSSTFVVKPSGSIRRHTARVVEDDFHHWPHLSVARVCAISASLDIVMAVVTYPLWHLKTREQAADAASTLQAARSIVQQQGPQGLYRGAMLGTFGLLPAHGAYICIYEWAKCRCSTYLPQWATPAAAAAAAECAYASLATPIEVLTVRKQCAPAGVPPRGLIVDMRLLWCSGGLLSFYRGGLLSLATSLPEGAIWWVVYEKCKATLCGADVNPLVACSGSAIFASSASTLLVNPMDVLKTRAQAGQAVLKQRPWRQEPLWCFFARGLIPRLATAAVGGLCESSTYEITMCYGRWR